MNASDDVAGGPQVVIVDDDEHVREALCALLRSAGFETRAYPSVEALATEQPRAIIGCLILDVRLPGKSGISFFEDEVRAGRSSPTVLISGHADAQVRARAKKAGAIAFFMKPVRYEDLLHAVEIAVEQWRRERR